MVFCTLVLGSVMLASGPLQAGPQFFEPGPLSTVDAATPSEAELFRIRRHLSHVEATLRSHPPRGLSAAQQAARAEVLDVLHDYWTAGVFPKNRDFPDRRVPYFIDADGTACAVGHLMIETGADAMAREIATYENYDFVADIEHPAVGQWLHDHGLTAAEAAWIQPTYGPCGFSPEFVCGSDGNTYECEAVAVECAGVEVASVGICGDGTGTDGTGGTGGTAGTSGTTTGNPEIIGPEICPEGTGSSGGTTGDSTSGESTTSTTSTTAGGSAASGGTGDSSGSTSAASSTGNTGTQDDTIEDKGCGCRADGDRSAAPLGLLLLALVRRRRTRGR